jgi:hypothetical protein
LSEVVVARLCQLLIALTIRTKALDELRRVDPVHYSASAIVHQPKVLNNTAERVPVGVLEAEKIIPPNIIEKTEDV